VRELSSILSISKYEYEDAATLWAKTSEKQQIDIFQKTLQISDRISTDNWNFYFASKIYLKFSF